MTSSILIVNDGFSGYRQGWSLGPGWEPQSHSMRGSGVPPLDRLSEYQTVAVLGPIESADQAVELGGGLRLAVEGGLRAVILFPVALQSADARLAKTLSSELSNVERLEETQQVVASHQSFYSFFGSYGRAISVFSFSPSGTAVLGEIQGAPAGLRIGLGSGVVYVLPFHVAKLAASYNPLLRSVLGAIQTYESEETDDALPGFVEEMRLPGEAGLLSRIDGLQDQVAKAETGAKKLRRHRQLIGRATGDALEQLVIEAFNLVLADTQWEAQDRPDMKAEDFWLVEGGEDRALTEVKGISGSINRQAVNQVDNHRAEHDLSVEDAPGILIVNAFRNSDDPKQRNAPVPSDVVRHAVRLNVIVLRTRDLYFLLHQSLAGMDAASILVSALDAGGGWLEVTESEATVRSA